jgi:hypothetical protein
VLDGTRRVLGTIGTSAWWSVCAAQPVGLDTTVTAVDTVTIARTPAIPELRSFSDSAIAAYRADPAYAYERSFQEVPSWWDQFKEWLGRWIDRWLGTAPAEFVLDNIWLIILILALALVLMVFRRRIFTSAFRGKVQRSAGVSALHEEMQADDLDERIATAERNEEWRRALRLHYLRALRTLVETGHITPRPEATDHDYLQQVTDPGLRRQFDRLAFTFQWVWYGEADLDRSRYGSLVADFRTFNPARAA